MSDITGEDIAAFLSGLEEWAQGRSEKDRKILNWTIKQALGEPEGELSDADLDHVSGGVSGVGPGITQRLGKKAGMIGRETGDLNWWGKEAWAPVGPYLKGP